MLYESLLLAAILFVGTALFIMLFGNALENPKRILLQLFLWSLAGIYFVWCWKQSGQTLAMQTWHLRLVDHAGETLSLKLAALRYVLATAGLVFFGAGYIWAMFDREHLFLHDRLLGSKLLLAKDNKR